MNLELAIAVATQPFCFFFSATNHEIAITDMCMVGNEFCHLAVSQTHTLGVHNYDLV